jgi:hypothetical protein
LLLFGLRFGCKISYTVGNHRRAHSGRYIGSKRDNLGLGYLNWGEVKHRISRRGGTACSAAGGGAMVKLIEDSDFYL